MNAQWTEEKMGQYRLVGSNIRIITTDDGTDNPFWAVEQEDDGITVTGVEHLSLDDAKQEAVSIAREQATAVRQFATGMRGQYIIGQALCLAIDALNQVEPEALREVSNIKDMEYLRDNLYSMYKAAMGVHDAALGEGAP